MRVFGPPNSTYAVNLTYDRHTDQHIISRDSIEHPSVGLASLAQISLTRRMVPITGRASSFLEKKKILLKKFIPFFALLSSSVSRVNLSCVAATIFSRCFSFYHGKLELFASNPPYLDTGTRYTNTGTRYTDTGMRYTDTGTRYTDTGCFSPTHFHHLTSIFWEWPGTDSRCLLLVTTFSSSSCSFIVLFALSFSRLILSLSLLCSSVTEALFALSSSFLKVDSRWTCSVTYSQRSVT